MGTLTGWASSYVMTFNPTDITHSITVSLPIGSTQYIFHNNIWTINDTFNELIGTDESLHITSGEYNNRKLVITGSNNVTVYAELNNPQSQLVPFDNSCFVKGTLITSDQGDIEIEKLDPSINTINNKKIVAVTKTISTEKYLIRIKQNALGNNIPNKDTITTYNHCFLYKNEMVKALYIARNCNNVTFINYNNCILYNILMEKHENIIANNMIAETLHPLNELAKMHHKLINQK